MSAPAKDFRAPPPKHPLDVVRRARDELGIRQVIVGFSGGKDAIATLHLCHETFGLGNVAAYFMYLAPSLAFQERLLTATERRYSLPAPILRIPHWALSHAFRSGDFRHPTNRARKSPRLVARDVDAYVRRYFSTALDFPPDAYIATGEKACDSIERNAIIRKANGIDPSRRRLWPVAWWNDSAIFNYLKSRQLPLPPEYRAATNKQYAKSFGGLWYRDVVFVRDNHPDDWERVKALFPLIDSQIARHEASEKRKTTARSGRLVVERAELVEEDESADEIDGMEAEYGE